MYITFVLILTFKRRRRGNNSISGNAAMPANTAKPMFKTSCETKMYILKMAVRELFCVSVASLHRNK